MSILSMMQSQSELCSESDIESQDDTSCDDELREFVDLVTSELQCDSYDLRAVKEIVDSFVSHIYHGYYLRIHGYKTITVTLIFMACAYLRKCTSLQDLTAVVRGEAQHTPREWFCQELFRVTGADVQLVVLATKELQEEGISHVQRISTYTF